MGKVDIKFVLRKINAKEKVQKVTNDLTKVEVVKSILSSDSIRKLVLSLYNLKKVTNCELIKSSIHDTYKFSGCEKNYILKLFKYNWSGLADIQYEVDALNFLKSSTALVSSPLMSKSGHYVLKLNAPEGERYFYLTSYAHGEELEYRNIQDAYIYGRSVAELHLASKDFYPITYQKKLDVCAMYEMAKDALKVFLLDYPDERMFFIEFTNLLTKHLKAFNFNEFEHGFCHGDLHGGNIKYCNNNGTFYDFDFCGYGLISYDLAAFKWMSLLRNNDGLWHEFLAGYRSVKNISDNELSAISIFVAIRDIWVIYLFINRIDVFGKEYISQPYIGKRMSFLKKLSDNYLR